MRPPHDEPAPRVETPGPVAFDLLNTGLRTGAVTVRELAALSVRTEPEVRTHLERLAAEGYVELRGEQVHYLDPEMAVAGVVRHRAASLEAEVSARLSELAGVVRDLPALVRSRGIGAVPGTVQDVEVFHGPEAVVDLWHRKQAVQPSRHTDVVLPDASRLFVADPAMQQVWHEASTGEGRARVIASIEDATHPAAQERVAQEVAGGVQIRLMANPPSWFWVADESTVALPLTWGESWPTSVVAVRSRPVAGLVGWLYERLWEEAVPVDPAAHDWDPLLALMNGGATLEAAARVLGISERTGRRRVSQAMDHYRAGSMLALGAAWGAARRRQAPRPAGAATR